MKVEDLVIGKEYYLDSVKDEKGTYKGKSDLGSVFFDPTTDVKYYLEETNDLNGFKGCVGFINASQVTPVEP
jgi:hypothetical protein